MASKNLLWEIRLPSGRVNVFEDSYENGTKGYTFIGSAVIKFLITK